MKAKNLKRKDYPFICKEQFEYIINNNDYKTERGVKNYLERINEKYRIKAEKGDVKELEIHIDWVKSRVWGMNPHATCYIELKNGSFFSKNGFAESGCGYDKESSVVAQLCNDILSGMLYRALNNKRKRKKIPYGISNRGFFPYFEGGVGMSCYKDVFEYLGGKMEHVVNRPNYDFYKITFK